MTSRLWRTMLRFWVSERGLSAFLVLLLLVVFVLPVLAPLGPVGTVTTEAAFSLLLVSGLTSIPHRRSVTASTLAVVAAALLIVWASG